MDGSGQTDGAERLKAAQDLETLLAAYPEMRFIDALFIDLCGIARGKRLTVDEARNMAGGTVQIPRSIYALDVTGDSLDPDGFGFRDGDPDVTAVPVAGTFAPRFFRADGKEPVVGQVLMEFEDKTPPVIEPRAVLAHVAERFGETGFTPVCALELEFFLIDRERNADGSPRPPRAPGSNRPETRRSVYDMRSLDNFSAFVTDVDRMAQLQGIPATVATSEFAPGQFEINLRHVDDPVEAADDAALLRHLVTNVADAHGYDCTFMSKPFPAEAGSGLHLHLSLAGAGGRNVFDDGGRDGADLLRHAIGGCLALMPASMAVFAANRNAYRRFQPNLFVPMAPCWGYNNRSVAVRVPAGPAHARRLEHRVAGAEANPYLALAALLAGVHHGVTNRIDPGPATAGNASERHDPSLPGTIDAALDVAGADEILRGYLQEGYLSLYLETKRLELEKFRTFVSPLEYQWYL
ncbi:glutamine synthetase family protein [Futiania mangrovi]|uniref:Glutamine synthetase family protein n=1 Tax=Futiania mangrovi TaxID=2959716 RepID=A0A9J6PCA2_9PROT|nr:glutamine synthetase family protein [Futiania mangrovii]MCP1335878.1 glutamine synthetase family protein [Futiania mangrovii]